MILVDTSAWIEWLLGSAAGHELNARFPDPADCLVPTVVQYELAKWLTREINKDTSDHVIALTRICRIAPLDTGIALAAADAWREHELVLADAIVFATARAHGATLLTCDAHFENLPGVEFVKKLTH